LERNEEQANLVFFLGENLIIFWMKKIVKFLDGKFLEFLFFTINSTNFSIFGGKKSPNFQYHKNIRKKKKEKNP